MSWRMVIVTIVMAGACGGGQRDAAPPPLDDLDVPESMAHPSEPRRPPPAQQHALPAAVRPRRAEHRYVGRKIDLDIVDADLQNVFRLLADVSGTNIVVAGDVRGTITLRLHQVPWDQALATIVRAQGLTMERDGSVILIVRR